MHHSLKRLCILVLASLALMSFRLETETRDADRLLYDVRGAFVAARPEVSADLMQTIHYEISSAIQATTRDKTRPRVVLTIRLLTVTNTSLMFGERASARVLVRAAAVQTGEVVAETTFTATILGLDRSTIQRELANGIADRVITEFRLDNPSTVTTALFPSR